MRNKKLRLYTIVWRNGKNDSRDQIVSTHENAIFATAKCERLNALFRADIRFANYGFAPEAGFYVQQQQLAPVCFESTSAAIKPQIKRAYIEP
jgi:hypothetical protein